MLSLPFFRRKPHDPLAAVADSDSFQRHLHRERLRADRAGLRFAILKLAPPIDVTIGQCPALIEVAQVIPQRIRETDCFGRFQDGLGVLLLDSDHRGAEIVANDLCRGAQGDELRRTIYVYPSGELERSSNHVADQTRWAGADSAAPEAEVASARAALAQGLPVWKRAIDVAGAAFGLLALAPLLLVTAILVKLTSPGPILFRQQRAGLGGEPFWMYKFRTMRQDAEKLQAELRAVNEQDGPAFKIEKDPRITALGGVLRKTCVDELPQLWNVLRGDMSLVGPRPLPVGEAREVDAWSQRRLDVTPGLTCIWQVSGGVNVTFHEWMRMDLAYIRQRCLTKDCGLILRTIKAVLLARASH